MKLFFFVNCEPDTGLLDGNMFPACFGFPALNILQIDAQNLRSLTGAAPVCEASVFQVLDVQWGGAQVGQAAGDTSAGSASLGRVLLPLALLVSFITVMVLKQSR
ncbi:hypothetical protein AMECASPLE_022943 [Ameca splendens]|uniref:Uncharacterized protein n=1 Tax=Ameca splendens TaxID=208324 RepID=A0ABV1AAA4_9TELE